MRVRYRCAADGRSVKPIGVVGAGAGGTVAFASVVGSAPAAARTLGSAAAVVTAGVRPEATATAVATSLARRASSGVRTAHRQPLRPQWHRQRREQQQRRQQAAPQASRSTPCVRSCRSSARGAHHLTASASAFVARRAGPTAATAAAGVVSAARARTPHSIRMPTSCSGGGYATANTPSSRMPYASDTSYDYDFFVIGAGSGGVRAARIAATHGARVAVAEYDRLGGTCVNVGCVPKKLFVYGAHFSHEFEDAAAYGWDVKPTASRSDGVNGGGGGSSNSDGVIVPDWSRLIANKDAEIERLNSVYQRLLEERGVQIVRGRATLRDKHTVAVGDKTYTAKYIMVAVGGRPNMFENMRGVEYCISSDGCFYLKQLPRSVLIVGGGYIATEFANIFNGYRSRVTQVYRSDLFLRGFDRDVRTFVADEMRQQGIDLRFRVNIDSVEAVPDAGGPDGRVLRAHLNDGSSVTVDQVLLAVGRSPNTASLGLEAAGVKCNEKGVVPVDAYSRTNIDNIYAIGDVTDRIALTPVAIAEGQCCADTLFGGMDRAPDHERVPSAVFCNPPIGTVGMTEEQAREQCDAVDIYRTSFRPLKHTLTKRENERTMMKLVVDRPSQRVLGVHVVTEGAGELIQALGIAVKMGAKKSDFDATMSVHPTSAEELVTLRNKVNDD